MKITSKILSIPPYLSTSWYEVDSLFQSEDGALVVALTNGMQVRLEHLSTEVVHTIFMAHARFLEEEAEREEEEDDEVSELLSSPHAEVEFSVHSPFAMGEVDEMSGDAMKIFMEHDPSRSLGPLLPEPLLKRVTSLAKMFLPPDMIPLDSSHENCRCPFCQIVRALSGTPQPLLEEGEEKKKSTDLREEAREKKGLKEGLEHKKHSPDKAPKHPQSPWVIQQLDDQTYTVTDRAHPDQVYNVSLATPVTCSCGQPNCVHIVAVLKS